MSQYLNLTGDVIIPVLIGVGYLATLFGMWWVRDAFVTINSMGILLFPILALWAVFHILVAVINQQHTYQEWFIWASRLGHAMQLAMLVIVIRVGVLIIKEVGRDNGGV